MTDISGFEKQAKTARAAQGEAKANGDLLEALRQSLIAAEAENRIAAMKRGRGITDPWCKP